MTSKRLLIGVDLGGALAKVAGIDASENQKSKTRLYFGALVISFVGSWHFANLYQRLSVSVSVSVSGSCFSSLYESTPRTALLTLPH